MVIRFIFHKIKEPGIIGLGEASPFFPFLFALYIILLGSYSSLRLKYYLDMIFLLDENN